MKCQRRRRGHRRRSSLWWLRDEDESRGRKSNSAKPVFILAPDPGHGTESGLRRNRVPNVAAAHGITRNICSHFHPLLLLLKQRFPSGVTNIKREDVCVCICCAHTLRVCRPRIPIVSPIWITLSALPRTLGLHKTSSAGPSRRLPPCLHLCTVCDSHGPPGRHRGFTSLCSHSRMYSSATTRM